MWSNSSNISSNSSSSSSSSSISSNSSISNNSSSSSLVAGGGSVTVTVAVTAYMLEHDLYDFKGNSNSNNHPITPLPLSVGLPI